MKGGEIIQDFIGEFIHNGGFSAARKNISLCPCDPDLHGEEYKKEIAELQRTCLFFQACGLIWFFTLSVQNSETGGNFWVLINQRAVKIWKVAERDIFYAAMDGVNLDSALDKLTYRVLSGTTDDKISCCESSGFVEIQSAVAKPPFAASLLLSGRVYRWLYQYFGGVFYLYPYSLSSIYAVSKCTLDKDNPSPFTAFHKLVKRNREIAKSPLLTNKILLCTETDMQVITPILFCNGGIFLI